MVLRYEGVMIRAQGKDTSTHLEESGRFHEGVSTVPRT